MSAIIDKLLLLVLGGVLLFGDDRLFLPVIILLLAVTIGALVTYFDNIIILTLLFTMFFIIIFFFPIQLYFLPLICYCSMENKIRWPILVGAGTLLILAQGLTPINVILVVVFCAISILLEYKTKKQVVLEQQLIRQRDSSVELNTALREKNQSLLEKQDYEIYLATLRERNRIAREIHDNVGHMLSRSLLQIGALLTVEKQGIVFEQLVSIKDTLNQAMNSIRESVHDLHDDSIDLKQAVDEIVKSMEENYSIHLDYDMSNSVPRNVKYCFIAIMKEAMSNVTKHSTGDRISIFLREHPGLYQLSMEDNGVVQGVSENDGIGLKNMVERVEALHGTIHVRAEEGFHIFISIPKVEDNICE